MKLSEILDMMNLSQRIWVHTPEGKNDYRGNVAEITLPGTYNFDKILDFEVFAICSSMDLINNEMEIAIFVKGE